MGTPRTNSPQLTAATAGHDGFRETLVAAMFSGLILVPALGLGGLVMYNDWRAKEDVRIAAYEATQAHERLVAGPAGPSLPVDLAAHGRDVFMSACMACHGPDAKGVQGLGKTLVESDFVALQSDEALHQFLVTGRPNATPIGMPPKGGRPDLTDKDLSALVVYMRGLQDPRRMPELPAWVAAAPSATQQAAALQAAGGDAELAKYIASGDKLYHTTCVACHGPAGAGVKGNGKALANNEFIRSLDDDGLLAFIKQGRSPTDPKNTTGIQMPPKGGNPAMSDDDILDVISYLRTLQGSASTASK